MFPRLAAVLLAFGLTAAPGQAGAAATLADGSRLQPVRFADLPGWAADELAPALEAFRASCARPATKRFAAPCAAAAKAGLSEKAARAFFESWFRPYRVVPAAGKGFVTGYFEPEIEGARRPHGPYRHPLLSRPADLQDIDPANPPRGVPKGLTAAGRTGRGWAPYPTRAEIEQGALGPRAAPLVYLADPVDAFFVHIQGSARIHLSDGEVIRVGFAGRNGHPYTAVGRVLIDEGHIGREEMTADRLRDWLKSNPAEATRIMRRNDSYIFFRELPAADPALGPIGAAGIPLTPRRSIAVDRKLHAFGTPVFIAAQLPVGAGGAVVPYGRLLIAQDTGSAIVGGARGDIFFGAGEHAGHLAGLIRHEAAFHVLLPVERRQ